MSKALTYINYLKIDDLLQLQVPRSDPEEHDEMLFIIIHQVYELWFKQILHEIDHLGENLRVSNTAKCLHTLKRMLTILKTVVSQIDVLETMTPIEFNSFRDFLESASGFQSVQFRELEFALGYKRIKMLDHFAASGAHYDRLKRRYDAPALWDDFLAFLNQQDLNVPPHHLQRDVTQTIEPAQDLQDLLVTVYHDRAPAAQVCERLVDFDEGFQEWRYRHMKMVERTIGRKPGTGGSSGVRYLSGTIQPLFPDLWAIRSLL